MNGHESSLNTPCWLIWMLRISLSRKFTRIYYHVTNFRSFVSFVSVVMIDAILNFNCFV